MTPRSSGRPVTRADRNGIKTRGGVKNMLTQYLGHGRMNAKDWNVPDRDRFAFARVRRSLSLSVLVIDAQGACTIDDHIPTSC